MSLEIFNSLEKLDSDLIDQRYHTQCMYMEKDVLRVGLDLMSPEWSDTKELIELNAMAEKTYSQTSFGCETH